MGVAGERDPATAEREKTGLVRTLFSPPRSFHQLLLSCKRRTRAYDVDTDESILMTVGESLHISFLCSLWHKYFLSFGILLPHISSLCAHCGFILHKRIARHLPRLVSLRCRFPDYITLISPSRMLYLYFRRFLPHMATQGISRCQPFDPFLVASGIGCCTPPFLPCEEQTYGVGASQWACSLFLCSDSWSSSEYVQISFYPFLFSIVSQAGSASPLLRARLHWEWFDRVWAAIWPLPMVSFRHIHYMIRLLSCFWLDRSLFFFITHILSFVPTHPWRIAKISQPVHLLQIQCCLLLRVIEGGLLTSPLGCPTHARWFICPVINP